MDNFVELKNENKTLHLIMDKLQSSSLDKEYKEYKEYKEFLEEENEKLYEFIECIIKDIDTNIYIQMFEYVLKHKIDKLINIFTIQLLFIYKQIYICKILRLSIEYNRLLTVKICIKLITEDLVKDDKFYLYCDDENNADIIVKNSIEFAEKKDNGEIIEFLKSLNQLQ